MLINALVEQRLTASLHATRYLTVDIGDRLGNLRFFGLALIRKKVETANDTRYRLVLRSLSFDFTIIVVR